MWNSRTFIPQPCVCRCVTLLSYQRKWNWQIPNRLRSKLTKQQIFMQVLEMPAAEKTSGNYWLKRLCWLTITCCESPVEEHITPHRPLLQLNMQFLTLLGLHLSPPLPRSFAQASGRHRTVHAWQHLMLEAILSFVSSSTVYNLDSGFTFTSISNLFLPKW